MFGWMDISQSHRYEVKLKLKMHEQKIKAQVYGRLMAVQRNKHQVTNLIAY